MKSRAGKGGEVEGVKSRVGEEGVKSRVGEG